jgi:hypothetical protein
MMAGLNVCREYKNVLLIYHPKMFGSSLIQEPQLLDNFLVLYFIFSLLFFYIYKK